MRRKGTIKSLSDSSSDDEPLSKLANGKQKKPSNPDDSSSESDIESYLQRPDKIDFDSPFFSLQKSISSGGDSGVVSRLTDSESENEASPPQVENTEPAPSTSKLNFSQLHEYTRKLEEAKKHVEEYNARRQATEKEMNVENLLAAGETKIDVLKEFVGDLQSSDFESCSESEKEGWEVVEEKQKEKNEVPKEGLQITVEMPGAVKKKKGVDLLLAIKRRINRVRKENQVLIHKVHLLCWIAHGNYVSSIINSQNVLAVALSLLPSEQCYPADRTDLKYLEQILKWYTKAVINVEKAVPSDEPLEKLLESQIAKKEALNKTMLVYIFVAILRSLGIHCRLVLSLQVEPLRPPNSELHSLSTKTESANSSKKGKGAEAKVEEVKQHSKSAKTEASTSKDKSVPKPKASTSKEKAATPPKASVSKGKASKPDTKKKDSSESKPKRTSKTKPEEKDTLKPPKSTTRSKSASDEQAKPRSSTRLKTTPTKSRSKSTSDATKESKKPQIKIKLQDSRRTRSKKEPSIPQVDGANDSESPPKPNLRKLKQKEAPCPIKTHPKRLKAAPKYADTDSDDDFAPGRSPFSQKNKESPQTNGANLRKLKNYVPKNDVRNDIINLVKKSIKERKDLDKMKKVKRKSTQNDDDEDSDYVPEVVKKHRQSEDDFSPKVKVKRRVQVKTVEEGGKVKKKQGMDVWAEVFLEAEEKWISVDVVKGQVHCVNELYTRATNPVSYIVAWNNDNTLKDITRRYCNNFNTVTRKLRIDAKWWEATLKPFTGRKTARDKEEDEELERQQLEKPLPTSIAEYKNHPLYVLKRHLLKFEALYPPEPPTLGFVRKEPVYSRQCVYTLHSRDIWLKHAKVVKPGEQPYKIVKARPRWDKLSSKIVTDQLLEIFGPWQVEDYVPPTAENGIVPRNAFGNVELFKPCMLPKKTVHLQLPGLNKVAKRMNIDCSPALTGFDFHGGWNHPVYDGFVVCEEFADVLVAAWEIEQEEIEKREQEKIDKRVYGNWRKLIRGLLIRERLKAKYEFGETSSSGGGKKKAKLPKLVTRKRKVESGSDSD